MDRRGAVHLTDGFVEGLKPEPGRQPDYYDDKLPGFGVRVSPGGAKTFFLLYRSPADGKNKRPSCGRADKGAKVDAARKKARAILTGIDKGIEPQRRTGGSTFADLKARYLEQYAYKHKKSARRDEQQLDYYVPRAWLVRPLVTFEREDIETLHTEVGDAHGKVTANRLKSLLHLVFHLAREWKMFADENPCDGIKRFKERRRNRFVRPEEMPRLADSLRRERDWRWPAFAKLSMLFGTRRSNLLSLAWDQIDFQKCTVTIDGANTKNGEELVISLSPEAADILAQLPSLGKSRWVFPAGRIQNLDLTKHLSSPGRAWARIRDRAGLNDPDPTKRVVIHSLRHTLGSWAAAENHSLLIVGRMLGHKDQRSAQIYANLQLDPVRAAVNQTASLMMRAMEEPAAIEVAVAGPALPGTIVADNVVELRPAANLT